MSNNNKLTEEKIEAFREALQEVSMKHGMGISVSHNFLCLMVVPRTEESDDMLTCMGNYTHDVEELGEK